MPYRIMLSWVDGVLTTGPFAGYYLLLFQQPTASEVQTWIVTIIAGLMGLTKLWLTIIDHYKKRKK